MRARAPKHLSASAFAALITCAALVTAGCSHDTATPPVPVTTAPSSAPMPFDGHVTIYKVAAPNEEASADANDLVPVPISIDAASKDPARLAIEALISCKGSPIPPGTKLLQITIDQPSGLATLNFSSEFKDNFPGGDTREAQVLNSILETMGQFATVQNVQFLVAGQKIGSLGGTQDISTPLPIIKFTKEAAVGT